MADLESRVKAGNRPIRMSDTNIHIDRPDCMYIFTGNLTEIDGYQELEGSSINGDPIDLKNKDPHDLVIVSKVIDELDRLSHDDRHPDKQISAKRAIRAIEQMFLKYGPRERDVDYTRGDNFLQLPNGARVFNYKGPFGLKGLYYRHRNRTGDISNDEFIQLQFEEFLKLHPEYHRAVQISQDSGYRLNALIRGKKADPSRFNKVKNLRQLNTGLSTFPVGEDALRKVKREGFVRLEDLGFNEENLRCNHILALKDLGGQQTLLKYNAGQEVFYTLKYQEAFNEFLASAKKAMRKKAKKDAKPYSTSDESLRKYANDLYTQGIIDAEREKAFIVVLDEWKASLAAMKLKDKQYNRNLKKMYTELSAEGKDIDPVAVKMPRLLEKWTPKGTQPAFLELMLDPEIITTGINASGGYGKTAWAILAGLYLLETGKIDKIHYYSAQASAEKRLAPVPGDKDTKINEDVNQAVDTFEALFGKAVGHLYIQRLKKSGRLEFDVIAGIIGRNLDREFVIYDECHFYDRKTVGYIIQRLADSKGVLLAGGEQRYVAVDKFVRDEDSGILHYFQNSRDEPNMAGFFAPPKEVYRQPKLQRFINKMLSNVWSVVK